MIRVNPSSLRPGDVLRSGSVILSHPVRTKADGVLVTVRTTEGHEADVTFDPYSELSVSRQPRPF